MRMLRLALTLLCLGSAPAWAQSTFTMPPPAGAFLGGYQVVASCGGASLSAGNLAFGAMDTTGKICINASVSVSGTVTANQGIPGSSPWPVIGATATTTVSNGTISATGSFQSILAASSSRKGCFIQNQGSHLMYVFFGANASATEATSFQLNPGQSALCSNGLIVATDNISLTGTSGDAFIIYNQ